MLDQLRACPAKVGAVTLETADLDVRTAFLASMAIVEVGVEMTEEEQKHF